MVPCAISTGVGKKPVTSMLFDTETAVAATPENTDRKQAGRFQPGQSGNLHGRPRGARNRATVACEALLDGQAEALTQKAIQKALEGDPVALRLCLDRIFPPPKDRPVTFPLPPITSARDTADLSAALLAAVAAGCVTPTEAVDLAKVISGAVKAYEVADTVERARTVSTLSDAELYKLLHQALEDDPVRPALPSCA